MSTFQELRNQLRDQEYSCDEPCSVRQLKLKPNVMQGVFCDNPDISVKNITRKLMYIITASK
jgi:hypothetical protein